MLKELVIAALIFSIILISGCIQQQAPTPSEGQVVQAEDQAMEQIEQEIDQAIENIDLTDIENSLEI